MSKYLFYKSQSEIGVDEAGRGPLIGRVYTAAVYWDYDVIIPNDIIINDSKKLTGHNIKKSAAFIKKHAKSYSINYSTEDEIDQLNILQATMKSMHESIKGCMTIKKICHKYDKETKKIKTSTTANQLKNDDITLLIDGTYFKKYPDINHICFKGGDSLYLSIACASILAKNARDEYIAELCDSYLLLDEYYGTRSNKGYGAKKHMDAIITYGISKFHRKSFAPCKAQLKRDILYDGIIT